MTAADLKFQKKLNSQQVHPVLYELIPPLIGENSLSNEENFIKFDKIINQGLIDAINIPEIHEESGQTKNRGVKTTLKGDPRKFAKEFKKRYLDIGIVVNHVVVHDGMNKFHDWIKETVNYYDIRNIVFVGGESSNIKYPGPGVAEASTWVNNVLCKNDKEINKLCIGGITIPTRNRKNSGLDEAERIINKINAGIEFFTSQVIYSSKATNKLLKHYYFLCNQRGISPKRIFLSFAPVSKQKDITFLKWLGVEIPSEIESELLESEFNIGKKSLEICFEILYDILDYCNSNNIKVPLGINVEHIMRYNIELSYELLVALSKLLKIKD